MGQSLERLEVVSDAAKENARYGHEFDPGIEFHYRLEVVADAKGENVRTVVSLKSSSRLCRG